MSALLLSMAASSIALSPLHTKSSNLASATHIPSTAHLSTNHLANLLLKPLKLANQATVVVSRPPSRRYFAAAFDDFEAAEDENSTDDEDLAVEADDYAPESEEGEVAAGVNGGFGSSDEGRLYVGNLPYTTTSAELNEIFAEAGRIASVEVIYDRVTDRSRGFGFVTMATAEEAKAAIRMFNESQLGGRNIKVNFPEVPKGGEREMIGSRVRSSYQGFVDSPHKVYAGNLGWGVTSQALKEVFAEQPGYMSAKVIYERDTGRSRGFGFVSFETAADADAALNSMNGKVSYNWMAHRQFMQYLF
ncbi:unnamed protein product [Linum tenue]|uniref:RRM domain-containing protein n=1 Tax=Linum tenue TaxID=586396 RepID=A0AAV0IX31_9ROSI|nr:unnamed protein product [Linum tenue]